MTDRFEESVREAAQGLGEGPSIDFPSYHDAWQRGRRRRVTKQAVLAAAGALVLVAALSVDFSGLRFGRPDANETDDVAVSVAPAATAAAGEPLATTAPVPTPESAASADESAAGTLDAAATSPTAAPDASAAQASPTATAVPPTPAPAATVDSQAEAVPAPTAAATAVATPTAIEPTDTQEPPDPLEAAATPGATAVIEVEPTTSAATAPEPTVDPALSTPAKTPGDGTDVTSSAPAPAARITGDQQAPRAECDTTGDAMADSLCELLTPYPCTGDGDVRIDFEPVDTDDDGTPDTCVATFDPACDTTDDGVADTACRITAIEVDPPAPGPTETSDQPPDGDNP